MDLVNEWSGQAATSIEAALLLRDLWEVLRITSGRAGEMTPEFFRELTALMADLKRHPFRGEEVLF